MLVASALAGLPACGGGGEAVSAGSTTTGEAPLTGGLTEATVETTTAAAPSASCTAGDILPVVQGALDGHVKRVAIVRCRNGYARVNAIPDDSSCPPTCYDGAIVYLRSAQGTWRIVDVGTGIECEGSTLPPLLPADRRACSALGYPQPAIATSSSFQMPSKNIGCRLTGHVLRCDILSGLRPEPSKPCELDWVGLSLAPNGHGEPVCAGDTAYDAVAPTLAYGDLWHGAGPYRKGIWCESRVTGLTCSSPASEGTLDLARKRWAVD
jgi:hypothetical protein